MAVRLSRPKFTWIIYISLFQWLTTYAKSVDSVEDSTDDEGTSVGHAPTMQTTDVENWLATPIDIFNSTGIEDLVELTMPTNLELKSEEYIETNSSMIGLYVGLPVGLFLILAVLAVICYIFSLDKMPFEGGTTSDQKKPIGYVQPSKIEKVLRDVSPAVSPTSTRRHVYGSLPPNVTLDASLVDLKAAVYEKLGFLLREKGAWRKLLQTEDKVTRKMEMDASNYSEDFEHKPGKKALDILSEIGWTIHRLRESCYQFGFMDCLDLLERELEGAEETTHINNGFSMENVNAGQVSGSSVNINIHQYADSEGLGVETNSVKSDQLFGVGDGDKSEVRFTAKDNAEVQVVRPVSGPFDVDDGSVCDL